MAETTFLTWPFFEETHRRLASELETWASQNLGDIEEDQGEVGDRCRELVSRLASAGWLDLAVAGTADDADDGGDLEPLDVRSLCLVRETLARHHGLADFAFAMQGLGSAPIARFGTAGLRSAYLPDTRKGKKIAAFALSEPQAGSDVAAIATRAQREGDHYLLNGTKTWISNGGIADYYTLFARTGESQPKGLTAFVVDKDDPGLSIAERIEVVSPHPLARLELKDCRVPVSRLLGEPGQGFEIAMATLEVFRSTVGAAALGFARRALDEALTYVEEREVFGQKLADFQITQAKLAQMATSIDTSALLVYRSAWAKDRGQSVTREASMAKMYATEAAQTVVDEAVQLFGARGIVKGSVTERLYREVRALRIYEGTSEIHQLIIAKQTRNACHQRQAHLKSS